MTEPLIHVDWRAEDAAGWLRQRAIAIRADAARDLADGYSHFYYEEIGFAVIAERAARAEQTHPPDPMLPCGVCHGRLACDLAWHRSLA